MPVANICNVCSLKFLPQALTMIWSLARQAGEYRFHLFLSDITMSEGAAICKKFPAIQFYFIDQFADQRILDNALLLTDLEFNVALKAQAMRHVLEQDDGPVFYCDSDLFFVSGLDAALEELSVHNILLTPHQIAVTDDAAEFAMARTGVFNSGFVGACGPAGLSFVRWWEEKCSRYCFLEPEEGLFVDQKWLDLAPAIFDGVLAFRHPGYNLAYWNLSARQFNPQTVVIHLSGLAPSRALKVGDRLSKYSDLSVDKVLASILAPYFAQYSKAVIDVAATQPEPTALPTFGRLAASGGPIIGKRYSAQKFRLVFENGIPRRESRPPRDEYRFDRLFRKEMAIIRFSRRLGKLSVKIGLGWITENLIALFRVLGRRNNWLE